MKRISLFLAVFALLLPSPGRAGLIRDAEVEHTIRTLADPIFRAAMLDPQGVHVFIVANPAINAYVAGGSNVFIHTGLLLATEQPEMLAGVIAHETGHIAGGHLARGAEQLERATTGAILSYIVGAGAIIAGAPDVGAAVLSGGPSAAGKGLLAFSRTNEQSADQAALGYLKATHTSPEGLLSVFKLLQRNEKQHYGKLDPYAITHPLTRERVDNLRDYLTRTPDAQGAFPEELKQRYQRMLCKLEGFMDEPSTVLTHYPPEDQSLRARYARAVVQFRQGDIELAAASMRQLIAEQPRDGYYYDTLGQILFEGGRIPEAVEAYGKAAEFAPQEAIIRTSHAQALLALEDPAKLDEAVTELEFSSRLDSTFDQTWRALATAYGKQGNTGMRHLALAEEAMLADDLNAAKTQSQRAMDKLAHDNPARMRASDIHTQAIRELAKKEDEERRFFR